MPAFAGVLRYDGYVPPSPHRRQTLSGPALHEFGVVLVSELGVCLHVMRTGLPLQVCL